MYTQQFYLVYQLYIVYKSACIILGTRRIVYSVRISILYNNIRL